MGKKIPLGKITITRKVTVRQQVVQQQRYQQHYEYEATPVVPKIDTAPIQREIKKLESAVKKATRPSRLPAGIYTPQVEQLYSEINKRSKPEEQ